MGGRKIYKRLELGQYSIPEEALDLAQDIQTLKWINDLIGNLNPLSLHNKRGEGILIKRRMQAIVNAWQTFAWDKLRTQYLAGKPIRQRQKPQTLADIWHIFADSEENMGKNHGKKTVEKDKILHSFSKGGKI